MLPPILEKGNLPDTLYRCSVVFDSPRKSIASLLVSHSLGVASDGKIREITFAVAASTLASIMRCKSAGFVIMISITSSWMLNVLITVLW